MAPAPLSNAALRNAADSLARVPDEERAKLARVVSEVLLAQAGAGSYAPSEALVDAHARAAGLAHHEASSATALTRAVLAVVRSAPRDEGERSLVSALLAAHMASALPDDAREVRAPWLERHGDAYDWLEFCGPYAPYAAARTVLPEAARDRIFAALDAAPIVAPSTASHDARRVLRVGPPPPPAPTPALVVAEAPTAPSATRTDPDGDAAPTLEDQVLAAAFETNEPARVLPALSIAGELEGAHRGWALRLAGVVTGWSAVRGALRFVMRTVFSLRSPATLTLDGRSLRVLSHTELLGRTLRTYDVQIPVAALTEVRREVRYPLLPVAAALTAILVGALFGARAVVEGAGVAYFPLIAIGLGALLLGVVVELLSRALFPGLRGRARLYLRGRDVGSVELTDLPSGELDRLLDRLDPAALRRTVIASPSAVRPVAPAPIFEAEPAPAPSATTPAETPSVEAPAAPVSNEPPPYKPPPMPPMSAPPRERSGGRR